MTVDYKKRHFQAMEMPSRLEGALLKMIEGAKSYCVEYEGRYGSKIGTDYVLGNEGMEKILQGLNTLLNGELGRLDGGMLSTMINTIMEDNEIQL